VPIELPSLAAGSGTKPGILRSRLGAIRIGAGAPPPRDCLLPQVAPAADDVGKRKSSKKPPEERQGKDGQGL